MSSRSVSNAESVRCQRARALRDGHQRAAVAVDVPGRCAALGLLPSHRLDQRCPNAIIQAWQQQHQAYNDKLVGGRATSTPLAKKYTLKRGAARGFGDGVPHDVVKCIRPDDTPASLIPRPKTLETSRGALLSRQCQSLVFILESDPKH